LFALMTFAAYGLVVHTGSAEAHRAGRVYLVMAVLGEAALVAGMLLTVHAASSHYLSDLAVAAPPTAAILLLLFGFGIKVGMPLLHMWLPLAHPVAPIPASAVLSGVMLKAGLLGWLRFLPLGSVALPQAGTLLLTAGLLAMFLGVAAGLCQREPKVLLAYSSISQMGFMTLGVGAGLLAPQLWPVLLPAVGLYALHHALAKSALFLGVGVAQANAGRRWVLVGMALSALALAGAPLTSGLLAKTALKAGLAGLPAPWDALLPVLLPLAALGTALLMARLLFLLAHIQAHGGSGLAAPWWMLVALGTLLPWVLPSAVMAAWPGALWPILLAAAIAALLVRSGLRARALPPGDILLVLERGLQYLRHLLNITTRKSTP
jgi:formate hydrogenlyase subunit 3/multisubunit Na+/H+ antiporter MnhD subunit